MMIGAGVSSLRALIMFLVRIGAEITGRDYDLLTSLFPVCCNSLFPAAAVSDGCRIPAFLWSYPRDRSSWSGILRDVRMRDYQCLEEKA